MGTPAAGIGQSLQAAGVDVRQDRAHAWYRPYKVTGGGDIACFFRDDALSDNVGFTYATWHGDDAVANLVHQLENIADTVDDRQSYLVSIVLDGENAWEYYPNNGYYF